MSLLFGERRMIDKAAFIRGDDQYQYGATYAGENVNFTTAMGLDAVAAGVGILSDLVYMLPLHGYSDTGGIPNRMSPEPAIVGSPSLTVDARVWRSQFIVSLALWGNAYGLVMARDRLEYPTVVEWLDPSRIQVQEDSTISRNPIYRLDGQEIRPSDLIHRSGRYVRPGSRIGIAPLEMFRETFGLALAARNYGAKWFGDGAHPSSLLQTTDAITPEAAQTVKDRVVAVMKRRREPLVLGGGWEWKQIQTAPNESQFQETQNASNVAVARALGLPADMIDAAVAGSMTYANREQRAIDFLTYHADPWLVRVEDTVSSLMPRTGYAKFERGALLRTDLKTRYEVHDLAIRGGMATPNQRLRIEDMPPLPNGQGDEALWPPYATAPAPPSNGAKP